MDRLDTLRTEIQCDPRAARDGADAVVSEARAAGDLRLLSRALGVRGRARRALGEVAPAEADLLASVAAADSSGDDELVADASIGLAGVLLLAGRTEEAFEHLSTADRLGSDRLRACSSVQRATVAFKIGQIPAALAAYEAAMPILRRLDMRVELSVTLLNRGVIRAQAGDFEDALADLTEAGELFAGSGQRYGLAQVCHGVGWAHARHGDLVQALEHLDRAADQFRALGYDGLEIDVDRVEVLLAAGLTTAAAELGSETARRAAAAGDRLHEAQMWLMCARASFREGDRRGGAVYAERARGLFAAQSSVVWQHLARLEVIRAGVAPADADELCALADALDGAGHARGAATGVGLAALAAVAAGDTDRAETLARDCDRRSRRLGVFEVRILARLAHASCAVARPDRAAARSHVRAGLHDLRRHRETLAATDASASVAVHAGELAELGLRLAVEEGDPAQLLGWMELARAGRRRDAAARPLRDQAAAAELTELRSVVAEVRARELAGGDIVDLQHRQRELEQAVHRRSLRTARHRVAFDGAGVGGGTDAGDVAGGGAGGAAGGAGGGARAGAGAGDAAFDAADDLAEVSDLCSVRQSLAGRQLLELAIVDGGLVGVGVSASDARVVDVGPMHDVLALAGTVWSALRATVAPRRPGRVNTGAVDLLRRAANQLDLLFGEALRGAGPVVLVVPPALNALPWRLLETFERRPVVIAPSASWWCGADRTARVDGAVVSVAGPRLVEATAEARAVAACHPGATVLEGAAATTSAVLTALGTARIVHVASHGHVRRDNPLWSSLELADGPLCVYDLEPLARTPDTVVLSGCETGVGMPAGDSLLGLARTFLEQGTRSLVASVCPLPDTPTTRRVMTALHEQLAGGVTCGAALASLGADPWSSEAAMLSATLTCFGTC